MFSRNTSIRRTLAPESGNHRLRPSDQLAGGRDYPTARWDAQSKALIRAASIPIIVLSSLLASACASAPPIVEIEPVAPPAEAVPPPPAEAVPPSPVLPPGAVAVYRSPSQARLPPTEEELKIVASAKSLLGQKPGAKVVVNGKPFVLDCIGTVSASYWGAGIDVTKDFGRYPGNGVNRLYMTLMDRGVLFRDSYPRPGDVIVWDNTWDANGNADRSDDLRTHAGLVISVDDDGTIAYLHESIVAGVVIEFMNLLRPNEAWDEKGKRLNSSMAISTKPGGPKPARWLAGDVFGAFGDVLRLRDYLGVARLDAEGGAFGAGEALAALDR